MDRTLQELRKNSEIMGGALLILSGDFRQTLPVIPKSTPADEINACLKKSHLWPKVQILQLTKNMRVELSKDETAAHFAKILLQIGEGDVYNVGMSFKKGRLRHVVVKFPYTEKGDMFSRAHVVASVKPRWPLHPAYMHTFGITENYFVIVEQPLAVSICGTVRAQLANEPLSTSLRWYPEEETHVILLRRSDGVEHARYRTEALFFLHVINAFEKDNELTVDLCAYKDPKVINAMYIHAIKSTVGIRKAADELFQLSKMDVKTCTKQRKRRTKEKQKEHTLPTIFIDTL
ncbi:Carotenoid isomerooxygenase [Eumeta japonica]|uniref:Carotenoid isomerooxygenase n=1 Tax=Eumeta variegata TaxID=151549 RepID=A0A4C1S833_EUMVA|nr:Carotenoid isomerooxygenase [Eumeta japonica]